MKSLFHIMLLVYATPWLYSQNETKQETTSSDTQNKTKLEQRIEELEKQVRKLSQEKSETNESKSKEGGLLSEFRQHIRETTGGLEFSGFFDVGMSERRQNPNLFELGDFEFDMEHAISEHFQVAAALVFNEDASELAVGFIDYHIYGGAIPSRGRLFEQSGFHVQIGKFDVSFGNDWQFYASADRYNISAPLTTENVLDGGYNDTGLRVLQAHPSFNYSLHFLKGKEEGNTYGGRLVLTPLNTPFTLQDSGSPVLELGGSYLQDVDRHDRWEERAWAVDLFFEWQRLQLLSEYVDRESRLEQRAHDGYHLTLAYQLREWEHLSLRAFGRVDQAQSEPLANTLGPSTNQDRYSLALGVDIQKASTIKAEILKFKDQDNPEFHLQLVVRF